MSEKAATEVWVIWDITGDTVKFYGALPSRKAAETEVALLKKSDFKFQISNVMLIGWAFNKETGRIYSNDDPSPPSSGSKQ